MENSWHCINWLFAIDKSSQVKTSSEIMPCQGLFLKSYSEDKVAYLSRVDSGKFIAKDRLSSKGVTSPNQRCWQRHSCLRGLNDNKGLFSKFILLTRQSEGRGKKLCSVIQLTKTFNNCGQYFIFYFINFYLPTCWLLYFKWNYFYETI